MTIADHLNLLGIIARQEPPKPTLQHQQTRMTKMTKAKMTFAFRQDADGYTEIIEGCADGSSILWDVRFPTNEDATAAIKTYKRRIKCRMTWCLAA